MNAARRAIYGRSPCHLSPLGPWGWGLYALLLLLSQAHRAAAEPVEQAPAALAAPTTVEVAPQADGPPPPPTPPWLPNYSLDVRLDTGCRSAKVKQTVQWTNPAAAPTDQMVFHVYPRHRPNKDQLFAYERTLESLRVDPRTAIDREGRRLTVKSARCGAALLNFTFDAEKDTVMTVQLPKPVVPGETIEVELEFDLVIPEVQGRFGQWMGVTSLLNWYPIVAYYRDDGWDAPPYIAWHQPWLNEAGNFNVQLTVPAGEQVATSGKVIAESIPEQGWKRLDIVGSGIRDFSIVASKRFEVLRGEVNGIAVQVYSFPEHRFYGRFALQTAMECLALYGQWFGAYPHAEFKIVESFFGWNGNESTGMVLVDERVFDAPQLGHVYIDHLISHEICHQWWYATVGTDGFRESWMDEALAAYFTEQRIKLKYGPNVELLDWPRCTRWLPNIGYHALQHYGYYLYRGRGGQGQVLGPLPDIGHVHNLFFLAYDRGSKVVGMIHQRLGDEQFMELFRRVYAKYAFKVMFVADFQRELEDFTGHSWQQFFDDWLRSPKIADWKIDRVKVRKAGVGYRTTVKVSQREQINEPVEIGYQLEDDGPMLGKIPLQPDAGAYDVDAQTKVTRLDDRTWEVTFISPDKPKQIIIDPDHRILDAELKNNRWKCDPKVRLTPLFTPLDEMPLVHPIDRPSIRAGPNVDDEGRIGLRGVYIYNNHYRVSPYLAYTMDDPQLVAGVETEIYNFPKPNLSIGARYEHTLATDLYDDPGDQGTLFLRWTHLYTTSFIYENLAFTEVYFRFGDNFFPDEDVRPPTTPGAIDYRNIRAFGLWYHLSTQMPYWNPEKGIRFDANFEHGVEAFGAGESFNRAWSQVSAVHLLPEGLGYFSDTRVAGRLGGGIGSPDNGEHFRFGGPLRFRGQRSEDTEGSAFWIASAEWRFPLATSLNVPVADNIANWRQLYASVFYDVGESFILDNSQGVDHAVGAGLYFQIALFSFLENVTVRVEYAHQIGDSSNVAWVGLYNAF